MIDSGTITTSRPPAGRQPLRWHLVKLLSSKSRLRWLLLAGGLLLAGYATLAYWLHQRLAWSYPVELLVTTALLGGLVGLFLFTAHWLAREISDRQRAEAALRQSEEYYRRLVQLSPDGITLTDAQGCITYASPRMLALFGIKDLQQVLGKSVANWIVPEDRQEAMADVARRIASQEIGPPKAYRLLREDHTVFWGEMSATPLLQPGGGLKGMMSVCRDVTLRVQAEEKVRTMERALLQSQRLESLGTLAAGVAHDLNNLLTPILIGTELLQPKHPQGPEAAMLKTMHNSATRGAALIRQVLTFGRGVQGQREPLQPQLLLREVLRIVEETFPKNIVCQTDLSQAVGRVLGDPTQLHQVLLNLCVNARDAMPGGGTLRLAAYEEPRPAPAGLVVGEVRPGRYVVLEVADTGQGIAPDILDKVFDPFFTTKEPGKGTGLGLSTVLGIVRSHGGFLTVESRPHHGTTFKAYLPALAQAPAAPSRPAPEAPARRGRECILLVDDEPPVRELTAELLQTNGYQVVLAANGQEALEQLAHFPGQIQLVMTDLMMPVMDGLSLIRALKAAHPRLGLIACTGLAEQGMEHQVKALGVDGFLPKPYSPTTVLEALHTVLNRTQRPVAQ